MKRFGIFLGYSPTQLDPHQGISRLITFLTKGLTEQGDIRVTIAGPGWLRDDIVAVLDDAGIDRQSVDIVTTRGEPYIIKIQRLWRRRRKDRSRKKWHDGRMIGIARRTVEFLVDSLASTSLILFLLGGVAAVTLALILFFPGLIIAMIFGLVMAFRRWGARIINGRIGRVVEKIKWSFKKVWLAVDPAGRVRAAELERTVRRLNKLRKVEVWYVPSMFWPEVARLNGKVVMAAPDIVFFDFPGQYNIPGGERQVSRINSSLLAADHLICYSDYVKQRHFVEKSSVPPEKVSVIRHGATDVVPTDRSHLSREEAAQRVSEFLQRFESPYSDYLKGFSFEDVGFLFYSSQVRAHKNIEALIDVYEMILRRHYRPIKLVLTADIRQSERLMRMIHRRGLQRDVLSIHSVPSGVLAALYRLAALQVTPTMFEGGFPFTFTEAFSVGTPSVMSRIPAVTELLDDEALLERMTFDPADRSDMMKKILWGLDNRDALLDLQRPFYNRLHARSWSETAKDYIAIMDMVAAAPPKRTTSESYG